MDHDINEKEEEVSICAQLSRSAFYNLSTTYGSTVFLHD